jgi:hypothetical protein
MANLGLMRIESISAPKIQHSYVEFSTNFVAEIGPFAQFLPTLHGYNVTSSIQPIIGPTYAYLEMKIGDFNP